MNELYTHESIDIAAPPEAVWRMLTDPSLTRQYMFGCEAVSDWKVGSELLWRGQVEGQPMVFVTGHVVTFQPCTLLEYTTFDPNGGLRDVPENYVKMTCRLTALPGGLTRLELRQGDFSKVEQGEKRFRDSQQGGPEILDKMKAIAERA
jgi:uncharacterized protein YndB with AHSA1/START domain